MERYIKIEELGCNPLTKTEREGRIIAASRAYAEFMNVIYPEWRDDPGMQGTPDRVAKMFINEMLAGIHNDPPKITVFDNKGNMNGAQYTGIVFDGGIPVKSMCSHHHMPFFGYAYVAYIPKEGGKIIGLSKLNRIVEFCSRRFNVQEHLTEDIHHIVSKLVGECQGVAVAIEARHLCVSHRGVGDNSVMKTTKLSGRFWDNEIGTRNEYYRMIADMKLVIV